MKNNNKKMLLYEIEGDYPEEIDFLIDGCYYTVCLGRHKNRRINSQTEIKYGKLKTRKF
jgi:hypothetical protein